MSSSRELEDVDPIEQDLAGHDPAGRVRDEPRDRQRRHALAATGFADEPEGLPVVDVEGDVVDGLDDAVRREEVRRQAAHLEELVGLVLRPVLATRAPMRRASSGDTSMIVGVSASGLSSSSGIPYCLPLSLGSSASRRPSPRKVKPIRARAMQIAGKTTRCGSERMYFWPSAMRLPHDARGDWTPTPM